MQPMRPTAMRSGAGAVSGGNAEQQLKPWPNRSPPPATFTFALAYVQALMENPRLYTAYREQHPQQNGGGTHG